MKRVFMFSYNPNSTNAEILFRFLDSSVGIVNWRYPSMPGTIFIVSRLDLTALSNIMHGHMGTLHFYLAEVATHSLHGWGTNEIWDFINNPPELPARTFGALGSLVLPPPDNK